MFVEFTGKELVDGLFHENGHYSESLATQLTRMCERD